MEVFYSNLEQLSFAGYTIFGGRESCDRVMIAFGNEADCGYAPAFPICTMKVSAVSDKFSDDLNHRDFLGALMNLGIEREMVGDILITESTHSGKHNNAYIFCVDTVADYIAENLTKIRHTNVKCTFCSTQDTDEIQIKMAQGAKPGEGGHLPAGKVYPWIAKTRHSTPGVALISPPPHHDIYSIEDLRQLICSLKEATQYRKPVIVKVAAVHNIAAIASGIARGGADIIAIDGFRGGTGAANMDAYN